MFLPIAFYKREFLPLGEVKFSATDLSIHRGYSIFDFFKFTKSISPYTDWYFERFYKSAGLVNLQVPYSRDELLQICQDLISKNDRDTAYIKLILSAGPSDNGFLPSSQPELLVSAMPFKRPDSHYFEKGAVLISKKYSRDIPEVKTTNYLYTASLAQNMQEVSAIDVLFHDGQYVSECSRSNIFIIKDQQLITPDEGILYGITRKKVLTLSDFPIPIVKRPLHLTEVLESDEVFITSTIKNVMPIIKIDEHEIADGKVGPMTQWIMSQPRFQD